MFSTDCPSTEIYSAGSRAVYSFCGCPSALRTRSGSQLLWPLCFHVSLNEMLNSDNKRSTPISSTQTETDGGIQRLSERSIAVLAQAEKSVVPMSSWLARIAAEKDRVRKQTFLKEIVAALERLQVCCTDASNPEAIPRQPPVDLYDRVFNYRGKMDGLFWHLQHSYCVIMEEKDGTRRADAQNAFKASVWPLYRNSPGADVARVVFQWLQALKKQAGWVTPR